MVYIYNIAYYSVIIRITFECFYKADEPRVKLVKRKKKYCMLMHIYGIKKDGTAEPICRAAMEMQT